MSKLEISIHNLVVALDVRHPYSETAKQCLTAFADEILAVVDARIEHQQTINSATIENMRIITQILDRLVKGVATPFDTIQHHSTYSEINQGE